MCVIGRGHACWRWGWRVLSEAGAQAIEHTTTSLRGDFISYPYKLWVWGRGGGVWHKASALEGKGGGDLPSPPPPPPMVVSRSDVSLPPTKTYVGPWAVPVDTSYQGMGVCSIDVPLDAAA